MTRRISLTFVLILGLISITVAAALGALHMTATNRERILSESDTIAKSEPVKEEFAGKIATAIIPRESAANPADLNHANDIARLAVESPAFRQAFVTALPALYGRIVDGAPNDIDLDPVLVNQAIVGAGGIPPPGFVLRVYAADTPDLHGPLDLMARIGYGLGGFGLLLVVGALIGMPHRGRAVMRIGRWLITVGITTILLFWFLPSVAFLPLGGWISMIGIILATGEWLAVPAALMTALGITILVMGRSGEAETRRRNLEVIPTVGRTPTRTSY